MPRFPAPPAKDFPAPATPPVAVPGWGRRIAPVREVVAEKIAKTTTLTLNSPMDKSETSVLPEISARFVEMAARRDRLKSVPHPDGFGKRTGDCGDTVEMSLTIRDDRIQSVALQLDGCINTAACANTVACMVEGKSTVEAWAITPEAVTTYLESLPAHETHCAELAVGALYLALTDYQRKKGQVKAP